jgi:hypothetical protein
MWPYKKNARLIYMPTQYFSYRHIMLSSQHRNTKKSKPHSCKHANAFAFFVKPCLTLAAQSGVQAPVYFYAISFQSVNGKAYWQYGGCRRYLV